MVKDRKLYFVVLLIFLLCFANADARTRDRKPRTRQVRPRVKKQIRKTGKLNNVQFDMCYDLSMQGLPSELKFTAMIPATIDGKQEIQSITYSTEPSYVYSRDGNTYAEFIFSRPAMNLQLKINVKATLHKYDLFTARKKYKQAAPAEPTGLEAFLKAEKHIEVDDPQIQRAAERIKAPSELEVVKKIYSYVLNNMKYSAKLEEVGAVKSLEKKRGNCMGYAQLFTALCRAKKIPSRVIKGYVSQYDIVPQHAWVEVYLKEFGWVPFDPTYGDANEKSAQSKRFFNLSPIYIYVNYTGADEMLVECSSKAGLLFGDITIKDSVVFK